jgi:hypothetical protein
MAFLSFHCGSYRFSLAPNIRQFARFNSVTLPIAVPERLSLTCLYSLLLSTY